MELGNCYEVAGKLFMDLVIGLSRPFPKELGAAVLVHGRPTLRRPPFRKYGHAWLEIGDALCYDSERKLAVPKALFYAVGNIDPDECYRYDEKTFRKFVLEFGHWGPWEGVEGMPPVDSDEEAEED
jgi:hypothetical protein